MWNLNIESVWYEAAHKYEEQKTQIYLSLQLDSQRKNIIRSLIMRFLYKVRVLFQGHYIKCHALITGYP